MSNPLQTAQMYELQAGPAAWQGINIRCNALRYSPLMGS